MNSVTIFKLNLKFCYDYKKRYFQTMLLHN